MDKKEPMIPKSTLGVALVAFQINGKGRKKRGDLGHKIKTIEPLYMPHKNFGIFFI